MGNGVWIGTVARDYRAPARHVENRWLPKQQFVCGTGELHTYMPTSRRCLGSTRLTLYSAIHVMVLNLKFLVLYNVRSYVELKGFENKEG